MSTVTPAPALTTTEQMLALPGPEMDRELIRGELREKPMTMRNRSHSQVEARVTKHLDNWLDTQPEPRGLIVSGEAGFRLQRNPDSSVGIDVAYVSAEVAARSPNAAFFEGPPVLAVEILSPSDTKERIDEKIALYFEVGVPLVWLVDPRFRTITVLRPDAEPELFNVLQELTAEPHLPGFRVPVAQLFGA
ncbi:MAG: Uma2 family endonuclease [Isosphaeraceae bacterium]